MIVQPSSSELDGWSTDTMVAIDSWMTSESNEWTQRGSSIAAGCFPVG